MVRATISELKNQLSAYLKKVRSGETVLIYDRDELVARLEGVPAASVPDEHLARLERAGVVRRGSGSIPREILKTRARLGQLLAAETGQKLDRIEEDTNRDFWLSADEAKAYGLIDRVIDTRKDLDK